MTPRQRYPELWAATYGAAWVAYPGAGIAITPAARAAITMRRAEYAAEQADAACEGWDALLTKRCNEEPTETPPHA